MTVKALSVSTLIACGEALQEGLVGRWQVDEQWAFSHGPDGLLPLVAIGTTPEAVVEYDGLVGAQQLRKLRPGRHPGLAVDQLRGACREVDHEVLAHISPARSQAVNYCGSITVDYDANLPSSTNAVTDRCAPT